MRRSMCNVQNFRANPQSCGLVANRSLVVDSADEANFAAAKKELDELLSKNSLQQTPILVLANKSDLPAAKSVEQVKEALELGAIKDRELCIYAISCKNATNIDVPFRFLCALV